MSTHDSGIGPTGRFPLGKLCEDDQGELKFAIGADLSKNRVIVQFGTPVEWLALPKDIAIKTAQALLRKASVLEE